MWCVNEGPTACNRAVDTPCFVSLRVRHAPHRALVEPSRAASRPYGFDPSRRIRCPSPQTLGPDLVALRADATHAAAEAVFDRRWRVVGLALRKPFFPSSLLSSRAPWILVGG